jgi:RHS repeat-associated protein
MPAPTREILLSRYHYDPLDRLVDSTVLEQSTLQRFYCKTRLSCEIQGAVQRTVVQHDDQLLAQQQREGGKVAATLLATDQQRSVLNALDANQPNPFAYSPYGHHPHQNGLLSLLGFNGEQPDLVTGHYLLGNYRHFNPVLMRFNSPDSWSPFGEGGINAYAYCSGDPINRADPNGRKWGNIAKTINKKLAKESGTALAPPASEHTIKAIDDLFKKAGGKAKFFKNFKKSHPTRTKFTAEALRRQTYATKSDMPDFKQLKTLREPELADMISITKNRINDLVRKRDILSDVNRLVSDDHSQPRYNLNRVISHNERFLRSLDRLDVPPTYEQFSANARPPSYTEATKNIREF